MSKQRVVHHTLPNGLRLYVVPEPATSAVTLLSMFQVGSRYETDRIAGISHFLEHMVFKGTKKRADARHITRELDSLGAEYNAFTSKDHTGYYIKTAAEHLPRSFDVMGDMLLNSKFAAGQVKRERHVIVEEMRMYLDNPVMYIGDIFESALFGENALGREIIGFKHSVLGTTTADLKRYWDMFYHPSNMVVVVAGNVTPAKALTLTRKYFARMKPKKRLPFYTCSIAHREPQVRLLSKATEQAVFSLGFPAYEYSHPKLIQLMLLHGILGSGMSARLFEIIREQMGLAYTVKTGVTGFEDFGAFYARAGTDPKKAMHAIEQILKEFARIKRALVTSEELERAKSFQAGQLALELEQSDNYAAWIGQQALFMPKIETPEQVKAKIMAVTREQIRDVAREVMDPKRVTLAVIGPFRDKKPFAQLLRKVRV